MKNHILPRIFIFLLAIIPFSSCSSDDDNTNPDEGEGTGNATYDGNSFNLSQGVISNYGIGTEGVYNVDIELLSDDFELDFVNEKIEGTGEVVYFEMWTSQASGLKNGTYTLNNGEKDFGITMADFAMDYNPNTDAGSFMEATSAEVTLNKSGSTYTLNFELNFSNGKTLSGTYQGNLYEYNYEEED